MNISLPVTPYLLREVSGLFPTGIAVIMARAGCGERYGVTIKSFSSVSIHYLRDDQHRLSARFARALSNKWDDVRYRNGTTGCPVLEPALPLMEYTL